MLRKPEVVAQRCFVKKVLLKISKKSQENICARVSFLVRKLQHRCFPVEYAKFILQNTSGEINKKRRKVHKKKTFVENNLLLYNRLMFLSEIKQRTPRVFLMLKTRSLLVRSQKLYIMDFLSFKVILIEYVHRILFCFSHNVLCKVS